MTQPTTPAPGEDSKGFWRNLILWALLALLLRWLVVEPRWIPSGSMPDSYTHLTLPTNRIV